MRIFMHSLLQGGMVMHKKTKIILAVAIPSILVVEGGW